MCGTCAMHNPTKKDTKGMEKEEHEKEGTEDDDQM